MFPAIQTSSVDRGGRQVDNEVCVYSYQGRAADTSATTVQVEFGRECDTQLVTVCQPGPGALTPVNRLSHCKSVSRFLIWKSVYCLGWNVARQDTGTPATATTTARR